MHRFPRIYYRFVSRTHQPRVNSPTIDYRHGIRRSEQGTAAVGFRWTISPEVSRRPSNTEQVDEGSDACLSSSLIAFFHYLFFCFGSGFLVLVVPFRGESLTPLPQRTPHQRNMPNSHEPTPAAPMEHEGMVRRRRQRLLSAGEVFLKKYRTEIAASASSCVSTFIAVSESAPVSIH